MEFIKLLYNITWLIHRDPTDKEEAEILADELNECVHPTAHQPTNHPAPHHTAQASHAHQ